MNSAPVSGPDAFDHAGAVTNVCVVGTRGVRSRARRTARRTGRVGARGRAGRARLGAYAAGREQVRLERIEGAREDRVARRLSVGRARVGLRTRGFGDVDGARDDRAAVCDDDVLRSGLHRRRRGERGEEPSERTDRRERKHDAIMEGPGCFVEPFLNEGSLVRRCRSRRGRRRGRPTHVTRGVTFVHRRDTWGRRDRRQVSVAAGVCSRRLVPSRDSRGANASKLSRPVCVERELARRRAHRLRTFRSIRTTRRRQLAGVRRLRSEVEPLLPAESP